MSKFIEFQHSGFGVRFLVNVNSIAAITDEGDGVICVFMSYKITDNGGYKFYTSDYSYEQLKRLLKE